MREAVPPSTVLKGPFDMTDIKTNRRYPRCKPLDPRGVSQLVTYLEQAERHLRDSNAPPPDHALLCIPRDPMPVIEVGPDERDIMGVKVSVRNPERKPRWFQPESVLCIQFLLAFGSGFTTNDNGSGFAYVAIFSGPDKVSAGRIFTNAMPGEVVRQTDSEGNRIGHREQDPDYFHRVAMETLRDEGKPTKTPYRGRQHAIETACECFRKNIAKSGIKLTEEEYRSLLDRAFALHDALHGDEPDLPEAA